MGIKIYGVGTCELPDHQGETVVVSGVDTSGLRMITDEHATANAGLSAILGAITGFRAINSLKDCKDEKQRKCWEQAQSPFIYFEAELADGEGHPNAQAAAALLAFQEKHPDYPLRIRASIEGAITERSEDKKTLQKTKATGFALTAKPCNPRCTVFVEESSALSKSMAESGLTKPVVPEAYLASLQEAPQRSAFGGKTEAETMEEVSVRIQKLKALIEQRKNSLAKSLDDYKKGVETSLSCPGCSHTHRFFKHSKEIPNRCRQCGEPYSMRQLFKAMDK